MWKNVFLGLSVVLLVFSFISCSDETETMFTVTFNSNGGSNVSNITGIKYGSIINLPNAPLKTGYEFDGWFIDNEIFQDEFNSSTVITTDLIVYAKWLQNTVPNELIGTWYMERDDIYLMFTGTLFYMYFHDTTNENIDSILKVTSVSEKENTGSNNIIFPNGYQLNLVYTYPQNLIGGTDFVSIYFNSEKDNLICKDINNEIFIKQ